LQGGIVVEIEVIMVGGVSSLFISTREKWWHRSNPERRLWWLLGYWKPHSFSRRSCPILTWCVHGKQKRGRRHN